MRYEDRSIKLLAARQRRLLRASAIEIICGLALIALWLILAGAGIVWLFSGLPFN